MNDHVNCIQWGKGIVKSIEVYQSLSSTNDFAKKRIKSGGDSGTVIWALNQTQGKGRRGRRWDADHSSLTFSLILRSPHNSIPTAITLYVGLGLVQQLETLVPGLRIKWPNDLWVGKKKLGGILTETMRQGDERWIILGMGLNINSIPNSKSSPRTSWYEVTGCLWARLSVLDQVLLGLERGVDLLQGNHDLTQLFRRYGNFVGNRITVYHGEQVFPAVAKAVLTDGSLLIEDARGLRAIVPDEISVRV